MRLRICADQLRPGDVIVAGPPHGRKALGSQEPVEYPSPIRVAGTPRPATKWKKTDDVIVPAENRPFGVLLRHWDVVLVEREESPQ